MPETDYTNIFFIIKNICNIATISILITLSIYHVMIYFGRRKSSNEIYNIYFAVFSFFCSFSIFITTIDFMFYINKDFSTKFEPIYKIIGPTCDAFSILGLIFGVVNCLSIMFNYPEKKKKYLYLIFIFFFLSFLFSLFNIIFGKDFYYKYIFIFAVLSAGIGLFYMLTVLIVWIISAKLYKEKIIKIILIGFSIFGFSAIFNRLILIYPIYLFVIKISPDFFQFIFQNQILLGVSVYVFAYAMANKFNLEHHELLDLKKQLEQKVELRTVKLKKAYEIIENTSKQKMNFFINIAHETKTPLTLISNYLEKYMKKYKKNDEEMIIIKNNIDKLKRDIINFMDIEKLERGEFVYHHNKIINLSKMIIDKIKIFKEYALKKELKIKNEIKDNIFIKMDPNAIDRVINNLLDNAIKYSNEKGLIEINLDLIDNDKVEIIVRDSGIGIPEEFQEYIFEPFYQISYNKKNIKGIGVGLSIVNKIIQEIHGKISVKSKINEGSEFRILLDCYHLSPNDKVYEQIDYIKPISMILSKKDLKEENYNEEKNTILCVEDNIEMLAYLQNELISKVNFFYAFNGRDALYKLSYIPKPDIIISDIMMDEMNGYEFYEKLQNNIHFKDIPLIFLTAKTAENEKIIGLRKGAVDFINKPFLIEEIISKIDSIIKNRELAKEFNRLEIENRILEAIRTNKKKKYSIQNYENFFNKYQITEREKETILLILKGYENKEIADKLKISLSTVKKHINSIYQKCNVINKIELANLVKTNPNL